MNRISELRKKLGLTQTRLGEEIGVSQQTISKYEKVDENISGDMLLALSKFFKVPVDYILRKDEEEQQREQDNKREIMELYRDMDQYNRDTWIIIGKRLLGGQLHKYNEDTLFYDTETGRYDIRFDLESFYGGLHCGECFDVKVKNVWVPVRIEMGDDWYLVGLNVSRLDGLRVRM